MRLLTNTPILSVTTVYYIYITQTTFAKYRMTYDNDGIPNKNTMKAC